MHSQWLFALGLAATLAACGDDDPRALPPPAAGDAFVDPVWDYFHTEGNCVTGGYVYRGDSLLELQGRYVYGDYGNGRIWSLERRGDSFENAPLFDSSYSISTFGLDCDGELLVVPYGTAQTLQRLQGTQDAAGWSYDLTAAYPQTFDQAVDLRCPGDSRLFVVEQSGRIRVFDTAGSAEPTTFLDLRDVVTSGGELGLLGLAFPPDYATRGQFFVYYTVGSGPWTAQLCRFDVSADPNVADRASEKLLLSIDEPYSNHNGGSLAFDADGMLLLGVGDGGSGGDPDGHGQDPLDLHGAILRLDVLGVDASPWYRIPDDNPFALGRSEFAPEVFAFGLRNPWRMSVDPLTGDIWCGDVGQSRYEEIDLITAGANYGWDCREGAHPYTGPPGEPSSACSQNTD